MKAMQTLAAATLALAALMGAAAAAPSNPATVDTDLSHAALTDDPQTPVGGNPKGDVTIVAFFDYNCPTCMRTEPALEALLRTDHGIRVVYKDWPIFGAGSIAAARVALAAQWQGRYEAVHNALLATPLRKTKAGQIRAIAVKAGANAERLDADLKAHGPAIDAILGRTEKQAERLKAPGTPVFLIGPFLMQQAMDLPGFQKVVAAARARATR